jgi:hypothetical protein
MRTWFVVVLALAGCGKDKDRATASAAPATPAAPGSAAAMPQGAAMIDIYINEKSIAHLPVSALQNFPRLDSLVPVPARRLGTWDDVFVKGKQPNPSQFHRISDKYPALVPALFVGADQTPSFGMFDPVELSNHGKPEVREDGVSEIRIKVQAEGGGRGEHESGDGAAADPKDLKVTVKTSKGQTILEGAKLFAVTREPMPGENDPKGWTLATVLKTAGVTKFERVLLTDATGLNLTLDKADFSETSVPYVKLNKQGALRVQVYKKQGPGWQRSGDLRGLVEIEVLK